MTARTTVIVIPIHNEAANIEPLVARIQAAAAGVPGWNLQLLFVDDGSSDDSIARLDALRARGVPAGYLRLSRNFGHQAALEAGLLAAGGDAVIMMDGDLQHPPEAIPEMIKAMESGAEVVQMVRSRPQSGSKGFFSQCFYKAFAALTHDDIIPDAADFRLLSRRVVDTIKQIPEREKFLRALLPSLGFKHVVLKFDEGSRLHGTPSYSFVKSLKLARKALFDFSTIPLRIVFWMGLTIALFSFVFGVGHVLVKLFALHHVTPGFTDIITAVLFLSGCTLAAVGILGRYLLMILEHVRGRPVFVVLDHVEGGALPKA